MRELDRASHYQADSEASRYGALWKADFLADQLDVIDPPKPNSPIPLRERLKPGMVRFSASNLELEAEHGRLLTVDTIIGDTKAERKKLHLHRRLPKSHADTEGYNDHFNNGHHSAGGHMFLHTTSHSQSQSHSIVEPPPPQHHRPHRHVSNGLWSYAYRESSHRVQGGGSPPQQVCLSLSSFVSMSALN